VNVAIVQTGQDAVPIGVDYRGLGSAQLEYRFVIAQRQYATVLDGDGLEDTKLVVYREHTAVVDE
jgi:hypothetical protein